MNGLGQNAAVLGLRSALFHLLSGATVLLFLPFLPLVYAPLRYGWPVLCAFVRAQLWLLQAICGQRFVVLGALPEDGGPVILASRHEALWETLVLPVLLGNPVVFLKDEILRYPVAGAIARKLGYIGLDRSGSVDRARQAFATARQRAEEGRSFLIFPSGTRDPARRHRVQKGVAVLYRMIDLPCVPVILNSGAFWPHQSWLRRPGEIRVRLMPAIPAGLSAGAFLDRLEAELAEAV